MKTIGLFSDIHSSPEIADLISETLEKQGVNSVIFGGDIHYKTMVNATSQKAKRAQAIREQIRAGVLKDAVIDEGVLSDNHLDMGADRTIDKISKSVAKKEAENLLEAIRGLDYIAVGGNWDYGSVMQEVFGDRYKNGQVGEIEGIKIGCLSGGGPTPGVNRSLEELSDNPEQGFKNIRRWSELMAQDNIGDILLSHIQFSDKDLPYDQQSSSIIENMISRRREQGKQVPEVLIHGHEHSEGVVRYDKNLDAFIVSPGCAATKHSHNIYPTFMTMDFDDDNKLKKVHRYEIRCSLKGIANVVHAQTYELDYKEKEVKENRVDKTVIRQYNLKEFEDALKSDPSAGFLKLDLDFEGLTVEERATLLDNNMELITDYIHDIPDKIRKAIDYAIVSISPRRDGKRPEVEKIAAQLYSSLVDDTLEFLGADISHLSGYERYAVEDALVKSYYGITKGDISRLFWHETVGSVKDLKNVSKELKKISHEHISNSYKLHLFSEIPSEVFQEVAELYMPLNYKRKEGISGKLDKVDAVRLWNTAYESGILTGEVMEQFSKSYKKVEDYKKNKKTKEQLDDIFGFHTQDLEEKMQTTDNLPSEIKEAVYQSINSGDIPVLKDEEEKEFVRLSYGDILVGDDLREKCDYTAMTPKDYDRSNIMSGKVPVIKDEDKLYIPGPKGLMEFDPGIYDIEEKDIATIPKAQFDEEQRKKAIEQKMQELNYLRGLNPENETPSIAPKTQNYESRPSLEPVQAI